MHRLAILIEIEPPLRKQINGILAFFFTAQAIAHSRF